MSLLLITQLLVAVAACFCILSFGARLRSFTRFPLPGDRSARRGDPAKGVLYALTIGMAPWAKESTRRHAVAYLRGVGFHGAVFLSLGMLLASPWLGKIPAPFRIALGIIIGMGATLAFLGFLFRIVERSLKALSTPDDYFASLLVSAFLAAAAMSAWNLALLPLFYIVSALVFLYMPLGKIRHCIYFGFSRIFFGRFFGRRGIFPHSQQELSS